MSTVWKVIVGLLLTLPMAAYITGTLIASRADMPTERSPIVISDSPSSKSEPSKKPRPRGDASPDRTDPPQPPPIDSDDDDDGSDGSDGNSDDNEVEVVRPTPDDGDDDEVEVVRPTPDDGDDDSDGDRDGD